MPSLPFRTYPAFPPPIRKHAAIHTHLRLTGGFFFQSIDKLTRGIACRQRLARRGDNKRTRRSWQNRNKTGTRQQSRAEALPSIPIQNLPYGTRKRSRGTVLPRRIHIGFLRPRKQRRFDPTNQWRNPQKAKARIAATTRPTRQRLARPQYRTAPDLPIEATANRIESSRIEPTRNEPNPIQSNPIQQSRRSEQHTKGHNRSRPWRL